MADAAGGNSAPVDKFEPWEEALILSVAASFNTPDREDLRAELTWRLLVLKRQRSPGIRNWRAYVYRFLRNKASNWIRSARPRERRTVSLDQPAAEQLETGSHFADLLPAPESGGDEAIALRAALDALPPQLRAVAEVLIRDNCSQSALARRFHKHRNTIRSWVAGIRQILERHGFERSLPHPGSGVRAYREPHTDPPTGAEVAAIPNRLIEKMTAARLNGTHWRILLWLYRKAARRRRKMVRANWADLARALSMDRAGIARAGKTLLNAGLVFLDSGRIGVPLQEGSRRKHRRLPPSAYDLP